jgi:hypothetical protein
MCPEPDSSWLAKSSDTTVTIYSFTMPTIIRIFSRLFKECFSKIIMYFCFIFIIIILLFSLFFFVMIFDHAQFKFRIRIHTTRWTQYFWIRLVPVPVPYCTVQYTGTGTCQNLSDQEYLYVLLIQHPKCVSAQIYHWQSHTHTSFFSLFRMFVLKRRPPSTEISPRVCADHR